MCSLPDVAPTTLPLLLRCHTRGEVRHALRTRMLGSPFRGVYVGCNRPDDVVTRTRAAVAALGHVLPASHHTAAALHGFGILDDGAVHLAGPEHDDHLSRPGLRIHSTARSPATTSVAGVLTVHAERAAVDLARRCHPADGLAVLDAGLRRGSLSPATLVAELREHEGLRGVVRARTLVTWADARAESPQETRVRWIPLAAGLPAPEPQIDVFTPGGAFRLDLGYREQRVAIEYDGDGHRDRDVMRRDRFRLTELAAAGWTLILLTDHDVFVRPQRTALRIGRALDRPVGTLPLAPTGSLPGGRDRGGRSTPGLWSHDTPFLTTTSP